MPLHIVYCFDEAYAVPALTSAWSAWRQHQHCGEGVAFHMVHTADTDAKILDWMKKRISSWDSAITVAFYGIDDKTCWATAQYGSHLTHVSSASNLRLCLPDILPKDVNRVLYLDCDTLVLTDVMPFVANLPASPSGVCARRGGSMQSKTWGKGIFPAKAQCLLAGVMVLDLQTLRDLEFCAACKRLFGCIGPANDQTIFNLWCRGTFVQLPPEMNLTPEEESVDAKILHYEGAAAKGGKPWEEGYRGALKRVWTAHQDEAT